VSRNDKVDAKAAAGVLGVGAVACVACCAGPVFGVLAGVGLSAVVGGVLFGVAGLVVVMVAAGVLWRRRQTHRRQPPARTEPVALDAPRLHSRS
jgi:hypothetical protein